MRPRGLPPGVVAGLLLLHLLPFATRPALIGGDEPHYALMAHSIAVDGDLDLADDYRAVAAGSTAAGRKRAGQTLDHHLIDVGGRQVFGHPLGLPLLAAPLVWVQQRLAPGTAPDIPFGLFGLALTFAALLAGWRLVWRWSGDSRVAALTVFGAYFSSPLWYYSRTFFTEPYTWSFAVLALAALASGRLAAASLLLALTLAMKETALLLVLPILAGAAWRYGVAAAARLAVGPAVFALLFAAKNVILVGQPLATFQPYRVGSLFAGARGLLVDPSRGLSWFAPLLLVAALAAWVLPAARRAGGIPAALAGAAFAAYFVVTAAWVDWRGGSGYGPRLLVPALAALAVPLAGLVARRGGLPRALSWLLGILFVAGFTVQWCAAVDPVPAFWSIPVAELLGARPWMSLAGALVGTGLGALLLARVPASPYPAAAGAGPAMMAGR